MKALFIVYNQAYGDEPVAILESFGQRGFTRWSGVGGRGSVDGIPRLDSHAWPESNDALLAFVPDAAVAERILASLKDRNAQSPELGLRAFVWDIENYC